MLTVLLLLWGSASLLVDPSELRVPNALQVACCSALIVYFVRTWRRPRLRVAEIVSASLVAYTLLLLPWIAVVWCRLGRPMDAYFLPQVAAVSIALVFPGRWWLAVTAMGLFIADSLFVSVYARHVGLEALIPITEPFATLFFGTLGTGLFIIRRRRRELTRQHVRVQAEIQALERVRPMFARASNELEAEIEILTAEVLAQPATQDDARATTIRRALGRLGELRGKLGNLVTDEQAAASPLEAERQLLARDAQLGAMVLAAIAVVIAVPATLLIEKQLRNTPISMFIALFALYGAILAYLAITRKRPSSRRALWAVLALYAATLPVIDYNQYSLLLADRPYAPFLGHKLLMGVLGLTLATRFKLGVALIIITAVNAIALWFVLDLGAHRDIIALGEPWTTLVYMLIGLASLRLLEQGQTTSIQLLRAEAEAAAMQRRALMFLALRDRLNSPLQTLVLTAGNVTSQLPASSSERVQAAIDRLVVLSRELAEVDMLVPQSATSLDADRELRRQL